MYFRKIITVLISHDRGSDSAAVLPD